jgi:hypothetical protein
MANFANIFSRAWEGKIADKWRKCEEREVQLLSAKEDLQRCSLQHSDACYAIMTSPRSPADQAQYASYTQCLNELVYMKLCVEIATERLAEAQDDYNATVAEWEDIIAPVVVCDQELIDEFECFVDPYVDIEVMVKRRKPRRANKASKQTHKLRVRRN